MPLKRRKRAQRVGHSVREKKLLTHLCTAASKMADVNMLRLCAKAHGGDARARHLALEIAKDMEAEGLFR